MIRSSFTAELHCQHGRVGITDDGWLCPEDKKAHSDEITHVVFDFIFLKQIEDRIHYRINCANTFDYIGARLEQDSNGWLGLYSTGIIGRITDALNPANLIPQRQQQWKVEILQPWDETIENAEHVEFYLRDHLGHRVALIDSTTDLDTPALENVTELRSVGRSRSSGRSSSSSRSGRWVSRTSSTRPHGGRHTNTGENAVKAISEKLWYLHAGKLDGEIMKFCLRNIQVT